MQKNPFSLDEKGNLPLLTHFVLAVFAILLATALLFLYTGKRVFTPKGFDLMYGVFLAQIPAFGLRFLLSNYVGRWFPKGGVFLRMLLPFLPLLLLYLFIYSVSIRPDLRIWNRLFLMVVVPSFFYALIVSLLLHFLRKPPSRDSSILDDIGKE